MKKFKLLFAISTLCSVLSLNAQDQISANIKAGLFIPFNDLVNNSYPGAKPDLFTAIGLGYRLPSDFEIRGELTMGYVNGSSGPFFYETSVIEGFLYGQYDLLSLLTESKFKIKAEAGVGLLLYDAKLYNMFSRDVLVESPGPNSSLGLSINPVIGVGGQLGYPVTPNIEINAGAGIKAVLFNDYMDVFESGESMDYYGNVYLGLTYRFGKKPDPTKMELDKNKYSSLMSTIDSLKAEAAQGPEQVAKLEMTNQENELRIQMLEKEIDSLKAKVVTIPTENPEVEEPSAEPEELLSTQMYRLIVASLPSRSMAQQWIDRGALDNSEMIIVHVEDLDTYRVIYRSFDSYSAARKELLQVRSAVPDAWIKKF